MNIYKVWQDRIDSGVFTKGHCQQFTSHIARAAQGLLAHGKRTNLTREQCIALVERLKARGGVRLTDEHTQQGLAWLRSRNGSKALPGLDLADVLDRFSHFLYVGDIQPNGSFLNGTLPVWRIVLTDGSQIDYWNGSWQSGIDDPGWRYVHPSVYA